MASYPSLTVSGASELLELYRVGNFTADEFAKRVTGQFDDVGAEDRVLNTITRLIELAEAEQIMETSSYQSFEEKAAVLLHKEAKVETAWARDGGFWRWWTFAEDAIGASLIDARYGNPGSAGTAMPEHYGLQGVNAGYLAFLWMRADSVFNSEDGYDLVSRITDLDFWRSHVVRVDQGCCHSLMQAFVEFVADENLPRGDVNNPSSSAGFRDLAKELRRRFPTIAFELMERDVAKSYIRSIWDDRLVWCGKE